MDYETKKNNCYSVYGSYDGILDFTVLVTIGSATQS